VADLWDFLRGRRRAGSQSPKVPDFGQATTGGAPGAAPAPGAATAPGSAFTPATGPEPARLPAGEITQ